MWTIQNTENWNYIKKLRGEYSEIIILKIRCIFKGQNDVLVICILSWRDVQHLVNLKKVKMYLIMEWSHCFKIYVKVFLHVSRSKKFWNISHKDVNSSYL